MSPVSALLFSCLVFSVAQANTPTDVCSNNQPQPTAVRVEGCTEAPCRIAQGTTANMQIDFRAPFAASSLTPQIKATVLGITVDFPLGPEFQDACQHLINSRCPVEKNQDVTYNFQFPVSNFYPAVKVVVQLTLVDGDGNVHFCTRINVQVVGAGAFKQIN